MIKVNLDSHDYARGTRFERYLSFIVRPLIYGLLKLSPSTAVVANVDVSGEFNCGIRIEGLDTTALLHNITIKCSGDVGNFK